VNHDQHTRRSSIARKFHRSDRRKPNSGVGQFAFNYGLNLFPQGLAEALAMIFGPSFLHMCLLSKTDEDIRNRD
jgi:hypothetical protein